MQEHLIPQDIVNYKFHLIGNLDLKQFGEVGLGVIIGFALFYSEVNFLIKWPLIIISVSTGLVAAFIPIADRPLSHWIKTFAKVIYQPTKFYWKKKAKVPDYFLFEPKQKDIVLQVDEIDYTPIRHIKMQQYLTSLNRNNQKENSLEIFSQEKVKNVLKEFGEIQIMSNLEIKKQIEKPTLSIKQVRTRQLQNQVSVKPVEAKKINTNGANLTSIDINLLKSGEGNPKKNTKSDQQNNAKSQFKKTSSFFHNVFDKKRKSGSSQSSPNIKNNSSDDKLSSTKKTNHSLSKQTSKLSSNQKPNSPGSPILSKQQSNQTNKESSLDQKKFNSSANTPVSKPNLSSSNNNFNNASQTIINQNFKNQKKEKIMTNDQRFKKQNSDQKNKTSQNSLKNGSQLKNTITSQYSVDLKTINNDKPIAINSDFVMPKEPIFQNKPNHLSDSSKKATADLKNDEIKKNDNTNNLSLDNKKQIKKESGFNLPNQNINLLSQNQSNVETNKANNLSSSSPIPKTDSNQNHSSTINPSLPNQSNNVNKISSENKQQSFNQIESKSTKNPLSGVSVQQNQNSDLSFQKTSTFSQNQNGDARKNTNLKTINNKPNEIKKDFSVSNQAQQQSDLDQKKPNSPINTPISKPNLNSLNNPSKDKPEPIKHLNNQKKENNVISNSSINSQKLNQEKNIKTEKKSHSFFSKIFNKEKKNSSSSNSNESNENLKEVKFIDKFPTTITQPNKIAGVVVDSDGKIINNALIKIVNKKTNFTKSIIKTNSFGVFITNNNLENGDYIIKTKSDSHTFPDLNIVLSGKVLKPISIKSN